MIYNHAYDIYNCMFRILALLYRSEQEFSIEQIRIFDFIIAFPEMINMTRIPKGSARGKKIIQNKYLSPQSHTKVFYRTENFQISALNHLAAHNIIDAQKYAENTVVLNKSTDLPKYIIDEIASVDSNSDMAIRICINSLYNVPVNGENGLKDRTKMMEYRYDG